MLQDGSAGLPGWPAVCQNNSAVAACLHVLTAAAPVHTLTHALTTGLEEGPAPDFKAEQIWLDEWYETTFPHLNTLDAPSCVKLLWALSQLRLRPSDEWLLPLLSRANALLQVGGPAYYSSPPLQTSSFGAGGTGTASTRLGMRAPHAF